MHLEERVKVLEDNLAAASAQLIEAAREIRGLKTDVNSLGNILNRESVRLTEHLIGCAARGGDTAQREGLPMPNEWHEGAYKSDAQGERNTAPVSDPETPAATDAVDSPKTDE